MPSQCPGQEREYFYASTYGNKGTMFLNCLVCQYLFAAINDAAVEGGWWKDNASFQRNPNMDVPTTEDIRSALNVSSMTTTAAPSGLFVNFAGTDDCLKGEGARGSQAPKGA